MKEGIGLLHRRAVATCAAAITAMLFAVPAASAVTYPQDYSAPNQAWGGAVRGVRSKSH